MSFRMNYFGSLFPNVQCCCLGQKNPFQFKKSTSQLLEEVKLMKSDMYGCLKSKHNPS